MLSKNSMDKESPIFNKIILFNLNSFGREPIIIKPTEEHYLSKIKSLEVPCEYIGRVQCKPFFYVERYIKKGFVYEEQIEIAKINSCIQKVLNIDTSKDIYIINRGSRDEMHKSEIQTKYSYHFIVDKIRINYKTLLSLIETNGFKMDEPFDLRIYKPNSGLFPIYTHTKYDLKTKKPYEVPQLLPFNETKKVDITKYLPTYIEESFIDYDELYKKPVIVKEVKQECNLKDDDDDDKFNENINKLQEIITKLNKKRATDRDSWINGCWCIINLGKRNNIRRSKIYEMVHLFSSLDNYDEIGVDKWLDINYDKTRKEGYGWKFLFNWLKEDNLEYYNVYIN